MLLLFIEGLIFFLSFGFVIFVGGLIFLDVMIVVVVLGVWMFVLLGMLLVMWKSLSRL